MEAVGEQVRPGVLSALGLACSDNPKEPYLVTSENSGRRLSLAKWIAHPKNPLTARSIVNRVWQRHFGKPLAGNPNNFGAKGKKPTHPKLLDWLAADFVENGWKFKRLHKQIMLSETYRQATEHPEIEKLRTKILKIICLPTAYPAASRPRNARRHARQYRRTEPASRWLAGHAPINMEVALQPRMIQFSLAPAYQPSVKPKDRNRRSLYAYRVRGQPDPFLELFNQPNPNDSCEERVSESVTPQAFTLLNSDLMNDRATALALRAQREFKDLRMQVKRVVQLSFGRVPDQKEWDRLEDYVERMDQYHLEHKPEKTSYPTTVTRSLVEEATGLPFEYEEILPAFENYQSDKKAYEVSSKTRALADLCLVLFNTNEFMGVY